MSLSSFLLKSTPSVDTELDALFKSQACPLNLSDLVQAPNTAPITSPSRKRKLDAQQSRQAKRTKTSGASREKNLEAVNKLSSPKKNDTTSEDDDSEDDSSKLVHESLTGSSNAKSKHGSKQKYVPPDETPAHRDQRTIFIGNLSLEVAQKRPLQKQLQRHLLTFIPTAKVESIRFRSIPFSTPTADLSSTTTSDPSISTSTQKKNPSQREHDRTRASSWRTDQPTDGDEKKSDKQYLNPNQKKKIAFINNEFHTTADTVHAYLVFAHPIPQDTRPKNLPPLDPVMNPYEAAKEAVKKADGSILMDRMIRVDFVGKSTSSGVREKKEGEGGEEIGFGDADPKCTLFVGNLDLESKEDDVRAFFESLMKTERGDPPIRETSGTMKKPQTWVTRVRIIRDKDTQLGKGFGYVQFIDRECIDELLTLSPLQLKFAKRKLRIQRCKTIPGTKLSTAVKAKLSQPPTSTSKSDNPKPRPSQPTPSQTKVQIQIPKGDPTLGKKIANLSKEQRKKVKASDSDRVARRLAKKKARMAMGANLKDKDKVGKKRERVRKSFGDGGDLVKRKKGRVRSEKSLEKRNLKK